MKTLVLIRHAKSSPAGKLQSDRERPLNDRGRQDAPRMAERLLQHRIIPDLLISSDGLRALQTADLFAPVFKNAGLKLNQEPLLYNCDLETMLGVIREIGQEHQTVFLFAHNPAISAAAGYLTGDAPDMPTAAVCAVQLPSWAAAGQGTARLLYYGFPKDGA